MAVLVPQKLLFLAHARTASNAISRSLLALPKAQRLASHHTRVEPPSGELTFSVLRDPMEILQGWYANKVAAKKHKFMPFPEFIEHFYHLNLDRNQGTLFYHAPYSDVLLDYAHLQAEWDQLMQQVGLAGAELIRHNVTEAPKPEVTPEAVAAMRKRFGKDEEFYKELQRGQTA